MLHPAHLLHHPPNLPAPTAHATTASGVTPTLEGLRLTARDLRLLYALWTARYLHTFQIWALLWPQEPPKGGKWGTLKSCQRRLQQLTAFHLCRRISLRIQRGEAPPPFVYALDEVGALLLQARGIAVDKHDWLPKSGENNYPYLRHCLETTDLRIVLEKACLLHHVTLESWADERELRSAGMTDYVRLPPPSGQGQKVAVIPDAVFCLRKANDSQFAWFFLEVDMGTVTILPSLSERRGWQRKIKAYLAYRDTASYRQSFGDGPAGILTVTGSPTRLAHLQAATAAVLQEHPDLADRQEFLFSTFDQALVPTNLLAQPIWTPADRSARRALLA